MFRRSTAAATNDIHKTGLCPLADFVCHLFGRFVILAECIGQACIGVHGYEGVGYPRQLFHMLAQLFRPQSAVEPNTDRAGVTYRVPEGFGGLAGKRTPGGIGDGAGNHHRQANIMLLKVVLNGIDRRFSV